MTDNIISIISTITHTILDGTDGFAIVHRILHDTDLSISVMSISAMRGTVFVLCRFQINNMFATKMSEI